MINRDYIIKELIVDKWLLTTVKSINQNDKNMYDDAYQDLIIALYQMDESKLINAYNEGYIKYTIVLMIRNQKCNKIDKSKARLKAEQGFSYNHYDYVDATEVLNMKNEIEEILKIINRYIKTDRRLNKNNWFKRKVFCLWMENDYNKSKVAKQLKIDRKTIATEIKSIITNILNDKNIKELYND